MAQQIQSNDSGTSAAQGFASREKTRIFIGLALLMLFLGFGYKFGWWGGNASSNYDFEPKTGARWKYRDVKNPVPERQSGMVDIRIDDEGVLHTRITLFEVMAGVKVPAGTSNCNFDHRDDEYGWSGPCFKNGHSVGSGSIIFSSKVKGILINPDGEKFPITWQ